MKYKKSMIIAVLAIFVLISIAGVSAGDVGDTTIASEDTGEIELSQSDNISTGNLKTGDGNNEKIADVLQSSENNKEMSTGNPKTFRDLNTAINANQDSEIYLTENYTYNKTIDTEFTGGVTISRDVTIYGNGITLDGATHVRIFNVDDVRVVFHNITFVKGNAMSESGGAIYNYYGTVTAIGCTFLDNHAVTGGAMHGGIANNCTFTYNDADNGGAIFSGSANNCTFTYNDAYDGGAIFFGSANNCTFISNYAGHDGGAVYYNRAIDCTFINNQAGNAGGAMHSGSAAKCSFIINHADNMGNHCFGTSCDNCTELDSATFNVSDFESSFNSGEKLSFTLTNGSHIIDGVETMINITQNGVIYYYFAVTGQGWLVDLKPGVYSATFSIWIPYSLNMNPFVEPKTVTVKIKEGLSFSDLNRTINDNTNDTIVLDMDYTYNSTIDSAFTEGIVINRPVTIIGNGYTINANGKARIFKVISDDVVLKDISFRNANASGNGGAVYFDKSGCLLNCNFTDNKVTGDKSCGGAVYFNNYGNVTNCNFTNNTATSQGGAVYFWNPGTVTNCNFADNTATKDGGAVYFLDTGNVTNCNFADNKATGTYSWGGAIMFVSTGEVSNCNFINNNATGTDSWGGAIYIYSGTVTNCNFTGNTAYYGGAVLFNSNGNVTNCNFTGNNAPSGSAIYFNRESGTRNILNSCFLNNRADAGELQVIEDDAGITITFKGNDNLLNAIYSNGDVSFTNVTYWGAKGIANTDFFAPSRSNNESGQNITVEVYDSSDNLIENVTLVTDANGQVRYDFIKFNNGNYTYNAYHSEDSYYTYANISGNFTLDSYMGDFNRLQRYIDGADENSTIALYRDYNYTEGYDYGLEGGIVIDKQLTINGNGHTINALECARIFQVNSANVVLNNITFANAKVDYNSGGAICFAYSAGNVSNCNFINNSAGHGGAIYFVYSSTGIVTNCTFANNKATSDYGGAVYLGYGTVSNCNFTDNFANYGGAVYYYMTGDVTNCNFANNTAIKNGGAVDFDNLKGTVTNCSFADNTAYGRGGAVYIESGSVENCNFTGNDAYGDGGAVCFYRDYNSIFSSMTNCQFTGNLARSGNGGAVMFAGAGAVNDCNFTNNFASGSGGAVHVNVANVMNSNFTDNAASGYGGAIRISTGSVDNCNFNNNKVTGKESYGGAVYFKGNGNVANCNFTDNKVKDGKGCGGAIYFNSSGTTNEVRNCNFTNNSATYECGAVGFGSTGTVENCNFIGNNATYNGGAIRFRNEGTVENCNFIGNTARYGGAVFFVDKCTVKNCNFTNNIATDDYSCGGGAIFFIEAGTVENCSFTDNKAMGDYGYGGAIYFRHSDITQEVRNCNFTNNQASEDGGAIYFYGSGTVENCNFNNNTGSNKAGAVHFSSNGNNHEVTNCNFTNNTAAFWGGGGIYFESNGTVKNCIFTGNDAIMGGGAIFFYDNGTVENCIFTDNTGFNFGGAVYFYSSGFTQEVTNCNFSNNSARYGGGIYFYDDGTVENCNFTNNTAFDWGGGAIFFFNRGDVTNCNFVDNKATTVFYSMGGAILFFTEGNVTNCNFTGNIALNGSAIGFNSILSTYTVSNSCFLNNKANAKSLEIVKNDHNITIIFTGYNNLLNAIYANDDVNFTNVTYWGANGIRNTGSSTIRPSRSNNEAGQNITVCVVVNDKIVLNEVKVTDEDGKIVLNRIDGEKYYISARHDADSYYTEAVKTITNMKFNVNVTSQTTTNRTVNVTAKSNIPHEILKGKFIFTLPNSTEIIANYAGNGTWWAMHTFEDYAVYDVSASYGGLDNLTVNNATITIERANSTLTVGDMVFDYNGTGSTTVSFTGASGVNASVVGQPNAIVSVAGNTITVSGLNAGTYTLSVTTKAYADYNNVTKTANITVNRINSTLTVGDMVFDYNGTGSALISYDGASGVDASVVGQPDAIVNVNADSIAVSGLNAGNYTLSVTANADSNHNNVTRTANITVNKVDSTLTVDNVVFEYNSSGSAAISYIGASSVDASVVGHPEAVVIVGEDKVAVSNLTVGNYTLTVTAIADSNHNNVTKTANITVNKADSILIINNIVFDYNSTGSAAISYDGASGVDASVVGHPEAIVNVEKDKITVSGLDAGNYTLTVTAIADSNHNNVTKTADITVNRINSTLTVGNVAFDYNSSGSAAVSYAGASGVNANVVGHPEAIVIVRDNRITVSNLNAGNYTLSVTTVAYANYNNVTKTALITVNRINSTLTVGDMVFYYNATGSAAISYDGATGVDARVVGQPDAVVNVKDDAITVSNLDAGNYTLSVTSIGDSNHNNVTRTANITVNKVDSTLTVGNVVFEYNSSGSAAISYIGASSVDASVVGHPEVVVIVGEDKIAVSNLNVGNYTLTVTAIADANHNNVTETANITVNKADSTLTLNNIVFDYNSIGSAEMSYDGATGIDASVVDHPEAVVNVDANSISVSGLDAGNYKLTVTAIGDSNHNNVTKTADITVNRVDSTLTVGNVTLDYGETANVTVTAEWATGITAMIDDNAVNVTGYTIMISGLDAGNHTLKVTTKADSNHNNVTQTAKITVNKVDSTLTVGNVVFDYNSSGSAAVSFKDASGVNASVVGQPNATVSVGENEITVSNLNAGNYTLTVATIADSNHNSVTKTANITVNKISSSLVVDDVELEYGKTAKVNVIAEGAMGITAELNGETIIFSGYGVPIPVMNVGTYNLTVTAIPDENHYESSKTVTVTVLKQNTTLDISIPQNLTVGEDTTVNVKLPGDAGGNVTLKVDGETVDSVEVQDGIASVKLPALSAGKHALEISYSGDDNHEAVLKTTDVIVDKKSTSIAADGVTTTYNVNKNLVITLTDGEGNPVAGVNVTVELSTAENYTTDENGQVKVAIGKLTPGTYSVAIAFKGNEKYAESNATASVVVKKAASKITAKAKTFKTTTKTKKYTVTLKNSKGNPIKNAKVYLKVKGKTYTAKTNSKGKATFKITKLAKSGKFKAVITFKGNDYYKKSTKKAKITVKSVWKTVARGSKLKTTVKNIQRALKNNGYYLSYKGHYLMVDGIFESCTERSVKEFQRDKGLKVTGKVDEKTARKLGLI